MKFNVQRLRNLTTGKLHTVIEDVYADIERIVGSRTHAGLWNHGCGLTWKRSTSGTRSTIRSVPEKSSCRR